MSEPTQMTNLQALDMLDQAAASCMAPRGTHMQLDMAAQQLRNALLELEQLKSDSSNGEAPNRIADALPVDEPQ